MSSGAGAFASGIVINQGYIYTLQSNITIKNNNFHDLNDAGGISMDHSSAVKILNNTFSNVSTALYIGNPCANTVFANNLILNPIARTIDTIDASGISENNAGIGTVIANNTFRNVTGTGFTMIGMATGTGTLIENNVAYSDLNDNAAYLFNRLAGGGTQYLNNNYWYNSANTARVKYGATVYALADEATWQGLHAAEHFTTPGLVSNSDFHPLSTSAIVKSGAFVPTVHDQPGCKDMAGLDCNSMQIPIGAYGIIGPTERY
jgi:hypothetical protein